MSKLLNVLYPNFCSGVFILICIERSRGLDTHCKQGEWIRCTLTPQFSFNVITDKHQHVHFLAFAYDCIQYMLYTPMKFVGPEDGRTLWPKHVGTVNSTYWARNCNWLYEGWNFNSGNYLFTTDTK